jgi:hypothetical protein
VAVRTDAASWTRFLQDSVGSRLGRQSGGGVCRAAAQLSDAISAGGVLAAARAARGAHAGRAAAWGRAVAWMQRCRSCRRGRAATLAGSLAGSFPSRAAMRLGKESLAI